jgi:hypothetical protein
LPTSSNGGEARREAVGVARLAIDKDFLDDHQPERSPYAAWHGHRKAEQRQLPSPQGT